MVIFHCSPFRARRSGVKRAECGGGRCTTRGLCIEQQETGTTLLSGTLPDQAALHGVLLQIIRLGLTLLSLETSEAPGSEQAAEHP